MNYLLTCADGLSWPDLAPFVRSARAFCPDARIVLFTRRAAAALPRLRSEGVDLVPLSCAFPEGKGRTEFVRRVLWRAVGLLYRRLRYVDFRPRLLLAAGELLLRRNQARYFAYRAYLEDCTCEGDRFLFCDSRDLVFQSDPFAFLQEPGAVLTQERADVRLADNTYNATWYRQTYGRGALERDGDAAVLCAGVLGGDRAGSIALLDALIAESLSRPLHYAAEQAILNHLWSAGKLQARILPNRGSLCWHLYGVDGEEIVVTPDGELRDRSGYLYPIVHMYDRFASATEAVARRWQP